MSKIHRKYQMNTESEMDYKKVLLFSSLIEEVYVRFDGGIEVCCREKHEA